MIVLDTNVVSEVMSVPASSKVAGWMATQTNDLYVTSITVAEVMFGIAYMPEGKRQQELSRKANVIFHEQFEDRILSFDDRAAFVFARLVSARKRKGLPVPIFDMQIAAITQFHRAELATRNTKHFIGCDLELIDPWAG